MDLRIKLRSNCINSEIFTFFIFFEYGRYFQTESDARIHYPVEIFIVCPKYKLIKFHNFLKYLKLY